MKDCCCELVFDLDLDIEEYELELEEDSFDFDLGYAINITEYTGIPYEGPYSLTPRFFDQYLPTKHKTLDDDVKFEAIEVSRVSNLSGGKTVYIGGIFNG